MMRAGTIVGAGAAFVLAAIFAAPLFPAIYLALQAVCHQSPERCFEWLGSPLPVCARCLGLYSGVLAASLFRVHAPRLLAVLALLNGADWVFGFTGNEARFVLAMPLSWLAVGQASRHLENDLLNLRDNVPFRPR